ncbi:MAG TPA: ABC transporter ATP-binding protein [Candidatus Eisenbacteria bacterium]|nr:ABC transporter ATP-binding protein [Candidatus Eisenbacteria bacterium]
MRLDVRGLTVRYGAVPALLDLHLAVPSGQRRAVIGPNGAGKTTLFNAITGDLRPTAGSIALDGRDVSRLPAWRRARLGLSRTFQRSALFPDLPVAENLALALRLRDRRSWRFWPGGERRLRLEVEGRLDAAGLDRIASRTAASLSHGEQRALEIELALAARPRLLLMDEPMAGLSGAERRAALDQLRSLPPDVTVVVVEHDLDAVFAIAQWISVLDHGVLLADGTPEQVRADSHVQEIYLGTPD